MGYWLLEKEVNRQSFQLNENKLLLPIQKTDMKYDERKKALRYLMFLKETCDGSINARGCFDGRPQQEYMTEDQVSLPTVSLEEMMLSCAIDVKQGSYVVITDIPIAFLHADMEDNVHILLEGTTAELIIKLEPSLYRKIFGTIRKRIQCLI